MMATFNNTNKKALAEVLQAHPEVEWILASAHNESLEPEGIAQASSTRSISPGSTTMPGMETTPGRPSSRAITMPCTKPCL